MKRSLKIALIIVAIVIVTGGTAFGVIVWATWGEYGYENTYYYRPGAPLAIENIDFTCDIGKININYNTTPTDYYAKVDLDIRIKGGFVVGKSFSDFFYPIEWSDESSPVSFDLDTKPTPMYIFGLSYNITIDLTLRTDVIYDINAFSSTGAINMEVPQNIIMSNIFLGTSTGSISLNTAENATFQGDVRIISSTGSVALFANKANLTHGLTARTSTGSLTLNFSSCTIGNDITGDVSTGSVTFDSYNMRYTKDCDWDISTNTGSIDVQIKQNLEMDANINGTIQTSTGSIDLLYEDSMSSIGSRFTCATGTGSITYTSLGSGGMSNVGNVISTDDYGTATNKYTFYVSASTGSIEVQGESL